MKKVIRRLDSTHEKLLAAIAPLDEESYSRRPSEREWSVAEIVHHLCLVEERVISDLGKALSQEPQKPKLLSRLVPTSIVASRVLRVQAPKAVVPTNPPEKGLTISNYNDARRRLKELYESCGSERLATMIFKHPFLGEISGKATISFVGYHEQRHYKQIREVLRKLEISRG